MNNKKVKTGLIIAFAMMISLSVMISGAMPVMATSQNGDAIVSQNGETAVTPEGNNAVDEVVKKIDAIGLVVYTYDCKQKIDLALDAYNALSEENKALVPAEKYEFLQNANKQWLSMDEKNGQAVNSAKTVVEKIIAIGTVTFESGPAIKTARDAYDALSDIAKSHVSFYFADHNYYNDLLKAEEDYKYLIDNEDDIRAQGVMDLIDNLGEVVYTKEFKAKLDNIKNAYNGLTAEQQALVTNMDKYYQADNAYRELDLQYHADLAKARPVIQMISDLGEITLAKKEAVENARKEYNKLPQVAKDYMKNYYGHNYVVDLENAEKEIARLEKEADDKAIADAQNVDELINAIGEVKYTTECKTAIDAARTAYDGLSDLAKTKVTAIETLKQAETTYATLKAEDDKAIVDAQNVDTLIKAIGEVKYTAECKDKIDAARTAYDGLSDLAKTKVTALETLKEAEATYATLKAEDDKAIVDANAVDTLINAIGEVKYTAESKTKIDAARSAYDKLSDLAKTKVTALETLKESETTYATLKAEDDKAIVDAQNVDTLIKAIGEVKYTKECKTAIDAARTAYDKLSDLAKTKVTALETLKQAETTYASLKAEDDKAIADGNAIDTLINDIGLVKYTAESKEKIDNARSAYNNLSDLAKTKVTMLSKLEEAEKRYEELKKEDEKATADAKEIDALINGIGEVTYTKECKDKIDAARKAYKTASQLTKSKVTALYVLEDAESKYAELKAIDNGAKEEAKPVVNLINKMNKRISLDSDEMLASIRAEYNKLSDLAKTKVTNIDELQKAEEELAYLQRIDAMELGCSANVGSSFGLIAIAICGFALVVSLKRKYQK